MEAKISKDMMIGDVVSMYPEAIDTLLSFGVHCVGCHVSTFESLEDGFKGHGMSDEDVNEAIKQLNQVVKPVEVEEPADLPNTVFLSDRAVNKIKDFCTSTNKQALRVKVTTGGCSGNKYSFDLEEIKLVNDIIIEKNGAKVYIDADSLAKIGGSTLDYSDSLTGAGFKIDNPSAKSTCGCGVSFR